MTASHPPAAAIASRWRAVQGTTAGRAADRVADARADILDANRTRFSRVRGSTTAIGKDKARRLLRRPRRRRLRRHGAHPVADRACESVSV